MEKAVKCERRTTNNKVEYEALVLGLQPAISLGVKSVKVCSDIQLIIN